MLPPRNSRPPRNRTAPSAAPQVMGNPGSFMQNHMQIQPQMAIPNNNPNTHFASGQVLAFQMNQMNNSANPPQFLNQNVFGFTGLPNPMPHMNQLLQMQQLAMQLQMASYAQVVPGSVPMYPNQMSSQGMGIQNSNAHLGRANASGTAQQLQGHSPVMNSFGIVQQPQTQNFNAPASASTQVCQGMGPQISNFAMNPHLGLLNANGAVQQMPNVNQQLRQLPMMNPFGFVQQPQTQNFNALASTNTQAGCVVGVNPSKGNQQNSYNSNFSRNQIHGTKKSKFGKGKFSTHKKSLEKGHHRNAEKKNILTNSVKPEMEKNRSLLVTYSAQEIRQWREERRKNYPSKAKIEKLTEKMVESEDSSCAAKLRRQQLKEVLAKQAELGFEVAEIPSSYLSDTEKQVDGREQKRPLGRKERFQKRFNKREKLNRNDRFSKKQRFGNSDSSNTCDRKGFSAGKVNMNRESVTQVTQNAREPTLLQKLLSSDIRRDKRRLLQVFRFMTMNSFFKDCPEKPLRFPQVLLKETGKEIEAAEEIYEAIDTTIEKSSDDNNEDEDNVAAFTESVRELQENSNSESDEPQ